jgi:NitT/TauT family transport system substrate-binding protein
VQSLIGGSADVVAGAFDHTIQMQAKGQSIVAVVELGQFPGFVLGILTSKAGNYRGPADLKGMKIGITAPGSSTHFMVRYLMAQAGLKDDDAAFIGIGAGPTAVAAARRGEIDALVNVDPVISLLESEKAIKVVADTRTLEGTRQVYGGNYPAAVIYVTPAYAQANGATVQALTNAVVRGLRWIATHSHKRSPIDAGRICAGRQRQLRALDQKQHGDVLSRRPVWRRRSGGRAQGSAQS